MGRSLFQLEDIFVSSLCFGADDAETGERFVNAFEEARAAMELSVRNRMRSAEQTKPYANETTVALVGKEFVVKLPPRAEDEILASEYGDGENRPRPVIRPGVQEGRHAAERAIQRGLEMP